MTKEDSTPNIDMEQFNEIFGDRGPLERELLNKVSTNIAQQVSEMAMKLRTGDISGIVDASHKLKGSALSIGLTRLGEVCDAIEISARDSDANSVSALQTRFQAEGDQACLVLSEIQRQF
jgi:HPt (histidine-containing phosphotransfer) domain-containing protein